MLPFWHYDHRNKPLSLNTGTWENPKFLECHLQRREDQCITFSKKRTSLQLRKDYNKSIARDVQMVFSLNNRHQLYEEDNLTD